MKFNRLPKHLLSIAAVVLFVALALASKVNKMHKNAFYYNNNIEDHSEKGNFLVKNDGTKVFGDKIKWKSGALVKDQVQIDGEKFPLKEIKGYFENDGFYIRRGTDFIKRIVHGKINVYVEFTEVTTTSVDRDGRTHYSHYTRADHYGQVGDNGPLVALGNQKDIQKMVQDCPLAVEMANLKNSKMRKAIKKNHSYLNSIFDTYNNGCKKPD
jgi:hypothetical protein